MNSACVIQILLASSPSARMEAVQEVRAVAGRGLEGDRYFTGAGTFSPHPQKPDFEITLIEQECVDEFARAFKLPFTAAEARRNIVTTGIRLNNLVGVRFSIGEMVALGMRLCEPCNYLAKTTHAEVLRGLVHKGGLRAQIIQGGLVRAGDSIRILHSTDASKTL